MRWQAPPPLAALVLMLAALVGWAATSARGADYSWGAATLGGVWSGTANWSPTAATGGPGSADTATLGNVTSGTRTVTYNSSAPAALDTLLFSQTDAALNELVVEKSAVTITNAITLGASSGTARLYVLPSASGPSTLTASGGITVNAGGVLSMGLRNPTGTTIYRGNITGDLLVAGGRFELPAAVIAGGATQDTSGNTLTGSLTMTSGTIAFNGTGITRRLIVTGNVNVSGGTVTNSSHAFQMLAAGATNVFTPASASLPSFVWNFTGLIDQTLSTNVVFPSVYPRGTGLKTYTTTATGTNFGELLFIDSTNTPNSRPTFRLGSNLTSASFPNAASFSQTADANGVLEFGIDADQYTFDFTAAGSSSWAPRQFSGTTNVNSGTATNTIWALSGTAGRLRAAAFNFLGTGSTTLTTTVGPGLILEAAGGNNSANTLSGVGAIDPTAIFRYSGAATVSSPATLTSDRAVPTIQVTGGALQINSLANGTSAAVSVSSGATLLVSNTIDDAAVANLLTGTYASGARFGFNTAAGNRTYATAISGTLGLVKTGANTLTLSGTNDYSGDTLVNAGTLELARPDDSTYAGIISGSGAFTKIGSGTYSLSGASTYTGTTTIAAGRLGLSAGNNRLPTATTLAFSGSSGSLDVGTTSQTVAALTTPNGLDASLAVLGGGSLTVAGATNLQIGPGGTVGASNAVALDLSGLSTFTYTNTGAGSVFRVGMKSGATNAAPLGQIATATLAGTNTISTQLLALGDAPGSDDGGAMTLALGQGNALNVTTITMGGGRADATLQFRAGLTNPAVSIRGVDGTSAVGDWLVGNLNTFGGAPQTAFSSVVDLSAGSVDALVTHLIVGSASIGTSTSRAGTQNSTFTVGSGTLSSGTITIGRIASSESGAVAVALAARGTLTLGNAAGTVIADTINLAENTYVGGTAAARTVTGTLALTAGTLEATTIQLGLQTGNATASTAFRWTSGTLANKAGTDLTVTSVPITLFSGSHTLNAKSGNTITIDSGSPISGADGFVKVGSGTLVLAAANTYSGLTQLSAGRLRLTGGDNRLPTTGTLAFTGASTFDVGATSQQLATLTTPNVGTLAFTVAGSALRLTGNAFEVGVTGSTVGSNGGMTMDMSGLSAFTYDNAAGTMRVGVKAPGTQNGGLTTGTSALTLATSSTITAVRLGVGDLPGNNNGGLARLFLGESTTLAVGEIWQGRGRADTLFQFASGSANTLRIRGTAGGDTAADEWLVGLVQTNATFSKQSFTSVVDLSAGSVDAKLTSLSIGIADTLDVTNRAGAQTSAFTMGSGTLSAATITVGRIAGTAGSVGGNFSGRGTLTIGNAGAVIEATNLYLAENTIAVTASTGVVQTVSGTVNLSAGVLRAAQIARGAQTGNADSVSTAFNWTGGTIENIAGGNLTIGTLPIALASGTGTFRATGANSITVDAASPISGSGSLRKTDTGTLVLEAVNTFAGTTTVAAGRLAVNGALASTSFVTVADGAELGGSGSILATIGGAGLVGPGNSPGITTAVAVDPTASLDFGFEFSALGDPTWSNAGASGNDVLRLTGGTPFTAPLTGSNVINVYFDRSSLSSGDTFRGGFFTDATGDFLTTIENATFAYYVRGNGGGGFSYNGVNYYSLTQFNGALSVTLSSPTVVSADFAGGTVENGRVTQFVIVPEPGTLALSAVVFVGLTIAIRRRK